MSRLLFSKEGNAVWISHLDLMRVFQRAFRRAGISIKHSQGFTPRAIVSIALPLSVGVSSCCELLDFDLTPGEHLSLDAIPSMLNAALPDGIHVLQAYDGGRKLRELTHLQAGLTLEYDNGLPAAAGERICALLDREEILVRKQTKNGVKDVNIRPMIRSLGVTAQSGSRLCITCVVCAQNPSLNPSLLIDAVSSLLPEFRPDHAVIRRLRILDASGVDFR